MKKTLWIPILCAVLAVLILAGICSTSTCIPLGTAVLHYEGTDYTLTAQEASSMRLIFSFKFYNPGIGGCPYEEDISISFGNAVFAIATDGCHTAKDWKNGSCIEFNRVEFQKLAALFKKYCGDTLIY